MVVGFREVIIGAVDTFGLFTLAGISCMCVPTFAAGGIFFGAFVFVVVVTLTVITPLDVEMIEDMTACKSNMYQITCPVDGST